MKRIDHTFDRTVTFTNDQGDEMTFTEEQLHNMLRMWDQ